jgi:hypothetical protein
MGISDELERTWQAWRNAPRPFPNFRAQHTEAPSYAVECDLDHQADYVAVLVEAWRDRNPHWDVPMRTEHELRDLADFERAIAALALPAESIQPLQQYARRTRALLETLLREVAKEN